LFHSKSSIFIPIHLLSCEVKKISPATEPLRQTTIRPSPGLENIRRKPNPSTYPPTRQHKQPCQASDASRSDKPGTRSVRSTTSRPGTACTTPTLKALPPPNSRTTLRTHPRTCHLPLAYRRSLFSPSDSLRLSSFCVKSSCGKGFIPCRPIKIWGFDETARAGRGPCLVVPQ